LHTPSPADPPTLTNARSKIKKIVTGWLTPTLEELEEAFGKNATKAHEEPTFLME